MIQVTNAAACLAVRTFAANFYQQILYMSHILVATDFSPVADTAIHYACGLAKDFGTSVTILHSFIIPVTFSDTPMPVMPLNEGREIAEERIKELADQLRARYQGLEIKTRIMYGDLADCLEEYTEETTPWLTILGNSGTGNTSLWLVSNVLNVLKHARSTVMAIPVEAVYKKPEKLCFACDFRNIADHLQTENLVQLARKTGAQLHVLNVGAHNRDDSGEMIVENTELHKALSELKPVYHFVEKENVEEGIEEFIEANQMDWLIIVPHKHSFFESLFHKSHTKAIMQTVHIPLVAMHEH